LAWRELWGVGHAQLSAKEGTFEPKNQQKKASIRVEISRADFDQITPVRII